jgi:dipeptidyl aminopeptidase/acylaminoacyl peptidase
MQIRHVYLIVAFTCWLPQAAAQSSTVTDPATAPPSDWSPGQMIARRTLNSVVVSPDGKRVLWTESRAVMTDSLSVFQSILYRGNADGSARTRLTFGQYTVAQPTWSPDGNWIAFLVTGADLKTQLAVMRSTGGELRRLTAVKTAVTGYAWAPNSHLLSYLALDEVSAEKEKRNKAFDDPNTLDEHPQFQHLWLVAVPPDDAEPMPQRLTEGQFYVSSPYAPGFSWSPDSRRLVFAHVREPGFNAWPQSDISVVETETRVVRSLLATDKSEFAPMFSPDGKTIALMIAGGHWARDVTVNLIAAAGGRALPLAPTPDNQPTGMSWLSNTQLLVTEPQGLNSVMYKLPTSGKAPTVFGSKKGVIRNVSVNPSRTHIGYQRMDATTSEQGFITGVRRFTPRQVTSMTSTFNRALPKTTRLNWLVADGQEIQGLLTYPIDYNATAKGAERVPLLLIVHGGPAGAFADIYPGYPRALYPLAAFAEAGYATLRINPRGSSGRGVKFRQANQADWGGHDYLDIMAGVDHVIALGVADPDQLGVMGWSYGGFMTSWILGHTDRFKAASIGAPVTDLVAFNGTTDIQGFLPSYFGGEFWEQPELYRQHSPLSHVANIKTPALIQHGEADSRVPLSQGLALYRALKKRRVPVKMVTYPRAPHGPREPRQLLHVMEANLDWFAQHMRRSASGG